MQQHTHAIAGGGGSTTALNAPDKRVMGGTSNTNDQIGPIKEAGSGDSGNLQPYSITNYLIKY